jgi:hypothetical protein
MTHATRWTLLSALALASVGWAAPPAAAQPAGSAQVILARAPAEVIARGQTAAAALQKGARLSPGDRVRTGRGGAAELVMGDGSLVRLGELSELEIEQLDVDAANRPTASRFTLAAGQARAWVARQVIAKVATGQGRFAVQTPTAVAAVRQTDFVVLQGMGPIAGGNPAPDGSADARVYVLAGGVQTDGRDAGQVVCLRNRYTRVQPRRDPEPCRIIPLWDKRSILNTLAFEGVSVSPGDLDRQALATIDGKLDKTTGAVLGGGTGQSIHSGGTAPEKESGFADVTITID